MKPDEPTLCNFYGYTLADYGLQLELAQELIDKAVKAEPKNVAYLDSLAWVLFKRGNSAKAEEVMRKVLELGLEDNGMTAKSSSIWGIFFSPMARRTRP